MILKQLCSAAALFRKEEILYKYKKMNLRVFKGLSKKNKILQIHKKTMNFSKQSDTKLKEKQVGEKDWVLLQQMVLAL